MCSDCAADLARDTKPSSHYHQIHPNCCGSPKNGVMRASPSLLMAPCLSLLMAPCLALNLVEMKPLAAAMLAKRWATDQAELDQKVGIREDGVTGVLRFGDDLRRRTEVAKTYDIFQKTSLALAAAAKGGGGATVCYAGHDPSGNQGHASSWR